ncbi:SRPBCC family protein [Spirosoma radiotolerans]|uniref:Cyclase n=1 Tax=Spirosoma radiotolerans TaxID=1379870 RepID=A0A0E3V674_9BACT|nr:SRPBCC family protein [Spirosoma radiotolerans]AKD54782.1 cyclase [Spirosoma radiotolerans]
MENKKKPLSSVLGIGELEPDNTGSSQVNVGAGERILSVAGGVLLLSSGLRRQSLGGFLTVAIGGYLFYRGASGNCLVNSAIGRNTTDSTDTTKALIEITKSLTVNKPREEVYAYWRKLENLPRFMYHLKEVQQLDDKRSHWVAQLADNKLAGALGTVEWDAQIITEVENEQLVWKSVDDAKIDNAGEVRFMDAPNGQGTEVHAVIQYRPPAGQLGGAIMKLFNPAFEQMIKQDLRRFKQLMETGEIATIKGQPSGRESEQEISQKPSLKYADADQQHESGML